MVTVYTRNNCTQCTFTKGMLDREGIAYQTINIDEDAEAMEYVKGLNITSAPVVVKDGVAPFGGFQPDKLMALKD